MGYTKGEWKVFKRLDGTIAICLNKPPIYQRIATILANEEHNIANGQLISAAPDLYEALEKLVAWAKMFASEDMATKKGIEALAKAEGRDDT